MELFLIIILSIGFVGAAMLALIAADDGNAGLMWFSLVVFTILLTIDVQMAMATVR